MELMRKNRIVLAAFAGIASGALGQSASLSIVASQTVVDSTVTTSITLGVYGDADLGTHIVECHFGLSAIGGAGVVESTELGAVAPWGELREMDMGDAGDGNHNGIYMGQLVFWPFVLPDPASALGSGPVLLATLDVTLTAGSSGVIEWTLESLFDGGTTPTLLTTAPSPVHEGYYYHFEPDFGSVTVQVVPAPSGIALLGLGGLASGRRRREQ